MRAWATRTQGDAYRAHLAAAGLKGSSWVALGIGLLFAGLTTGAGALTVAAAAMLFAGE